MARQHRDGTFSVRVKRNDKHFKTMNSRELRLHKLEVAAALTEERGLKLH